jgi:hypothetical protein
MFVTGHHEPLWPFPRLPETFTARYSTGQLTLRPFGIFESDLNVNFNSAARPFLVTEILRCCARDAQTGEIEPGFFWELTVGKRIECLLRLIASGAGGELALTLRCANTACGEQMETTIAVAEIAALQDEAYETERVAVRLEARALAFRRPRASDQVAWLKSRATGEGGAIGAMLRTLVLESAEHCSVVDEAVSSRPWIEAIDRAMEEHDPLVNFTLQSLCPYCEEENLYEIDLEGLSLERLRQAQLRLLASVHRLAAHYHWSEQQIFSVPYWRRAYYLSLIEKEKNL